MGLENLKSIFNTTAGTSTSKKEGRHGGIDESLPPHTDKHSSLDNTTILDSLVTNKLGFDTSGIGGLDLSGYANGQVGDVNPTNESFNFGIQFTNSLTPSNITISGINDGALGILEWFNISGDRFSVDHASGQVSFNFSGTPTPTPYEETIWELGTPALGNLIPKGSLSNENALDFNVPYRGNIFQVRDEENLDQLKRTVFVKNRIPVGTLQDPISGWINEFLGTVNLSGGYALGDFFNISTPAGFSITGDLSDISLNYRPRLSFNADTFFASIREAFETRVIETTTQQLEESFASQIGNTWNNISSGLSDIADSLGFSQASVFQTSVFSSGFGGDLSGLGSYISGLQSSLLSGDEIGTQTYQQLRKSLTDVNYPGFGGSAAKNIRGIQGPRGLSNPEATQYKAGEPIRSQTSPGKDAQDIDIVQSPSAGPYSKLMQAVDRIDEFQYSPKGYEKNFTRGSLNPDNLENFGEGDKKGDYMTLNPISNGPKAFPEKDRGKVTEGKKGMQFWFKDKRNFKFVTFRAYLEAITENVAPSWSSENYIGKSEPVFVYERAERDISFQLKLYAGTKDELDAIYNKINALTSFCYPEYQADSKFSVSSYSNGKLRMKPPLLEMRMGNLYGNELGGVQGFIKSLTYSVPDNSDWEVKDGLIVPKLFTVSITYQIIHSTSPNINTQFYGLGKYQ